MLLLPLVVKPPNNTAVLLVTDVRVKSSIGGGLSPVTVGEIHSPKNNNNETPTVRGLAAEKNNKLYTETMIFLWNNHYNLNFNV